VLSFITDLCTPHNGGLMILTPVKNSSRAPGTSYRNSVCPSDCLSVRHNPVPIEAQVR